jgi:hypothetical protein
MNLHPYKVTDGELRLPDEIFQPLLAGFQPQLYYS